MNGKSRPAPSPTNLQINVFDLVQMRVDLETLKETPDLTAAKTKLDTIILNFVNGLLPN
jgi:hypothetical protein